MIIVWESHQGRHINGIGGDIFGINDLVIEEVSPPIPGVSDDKTLLSNKESFISGGVMVLSEV